MTHRAPKTGKNLVNCDLGAAAIEFAMVVPVFLTFVVGILAYGLYFGATFSVQQLSADAARASIAGTTDAERRKLVTDFIAAAAPSYALIVPDKISTSAAPSAGDPTLFEVTVTYDSSDLPIFQFASFIPLPQKTIRRNTVIKTGGF